MITETENYLLIFYRTFSQRKLLMHAIVQLSAHKWRSTCPATCKYECFSLVILLCKKKLNCGVCNSWVLDVLRELFKDLKDSLLATFKIGMPSILNIKKQ